jgi:hypothetical protein
VASPGEPDSAPADSEVRRISGGAVTLGVPQARYDRTDVTEADRDEVIDCLKRAYVRDELTTEALGERVGIAHSAETLDELDAALEDVEPG